MHQEVVQKYLDAIDEGRPGFVQGLYVVGSAALGAWQAGVSDVDTVILTAWRPDAADISALTKIHADLAGPPHLDGVNLEPDLARVWPDDHPVVPFVVNGQLKSDTPCGELGPVLWLTLREHGIAVRGPAVADLDVRVDQEALRRYNLENLRDYWRASAESFGPALEKMPDDRVMDADTVTWFVLGPPRLHYTLEHGTVASKATAGAYLAELLPEYADLVRRSLRWRAGEAEQFGKADLAEAGRATIAVADSAWRKFGQ